MRHTFAPRIQTLTDLISVLVEVFEQLVVVLLSGQQLLLCLRLSTTLLLLLALRNDAAIIPTAIRSSRGLRHFALLETLLKLREALNLGQDVHMRLAQYLRQYEPLVEGQEQSVIDICLYFAHLVLVLLHLLWQRRR